jgi:tRNA (cytidine/uridine-2'-O-)-methyltransferase
MIQKSLPKLHRRDALMIVLTTRGSQTFHYVRYQTGDAFLFGPESRGLPADVLSGFDAGRRVRLPMLADSRSLNLSNTVAVVVYEAWRQCSFESALTHSRQNGQPGS